MRPKLLDLFCGAGGIAEGYRRAGFDVIGIDIEPQPHYPFPFVQGCAIRMMHWLLDGNGFGTGEHCPPMNVGPHYGLRDFAAIHASPPCQGYSRMRHLPWLKGKTYPMLIDLLAIIAGREGCLQNEIRSALFAIRRLPKETPLATALALIPRRRA